jgi:hypothetical protein
MKLHKVLSKHKLDKLKILLVNKEHKLYDGLFDPHTFTITIYLKNNSDLKEIMAHELVHAILYKRSKGKFYLNHNSKFYILMSQIIKEI